MRKMRKRKRKEEKLKQAGKNRKKEILIPIIPEIVRSINYENEEIIIANMDGLID